MSVSRKLVVGAAPQGTTDAGSAAQAVREMFTSIAPRYDLLNHVLSFNIDRVWWRRTARTFREVLSRPDARVLDLCCGTGDMTFALQRQAEKSLPLPSSQSRPLARPWRARVPAPHKAALPQLFGADFSHAMLQRALSKSTGASAEHSSNDASNVPPTNSEPAMPRWVEADALNLPFPSRHFDLVTSAFGFRNLADYDAGLREIVRILRPGGECGILDFGEPKGIMGQLYRIYFKQILPRVGTMISGVRGPYAYLPASVERFPAPEEMLARMRQAGFTEAGWTPYTFGIAGLYRGRKIAA
jgi:demethylmenaquinone methyltransferase / 2-methoxy-6-polyprenyl-1,4-benzoquinol methylase